MSYTQLLDNAVYDISMVTSWRQKHIDTDMFYETLLKSGRDVYQLEIPVSIRIYILKTFITYI